MDQFSIGCFKIGYLYGFAIGTAMVLADEKGNVRKPKKFGPLLQMDSLIIDYLIDKSNVRLLDIMWYVGLENNKANQISVGHAMGRLGWVRRRRGTGRNREWFYERGANSGAYAGGPLT